MNEENNKELVDDIKEGVINDVVSPVDIQNKSYSWILLNSRTYIFEMISNNKDLNKLIKYFLKLSLIYSAAFGFSLGFYTLNLQILFSTIKTPLLVLGTMGICLPALFTFNILLGSKLAIRQTLAVLSVTTYLLSLILVSLSPILLFFIVSTQQRNFITLLTVVCCVIAGSLSVKLLWETMDYLTKKSSSSANTAIIKTWSFIYMFVGAQFAWILRPFIGEKGDFALFRYLEGNFYYAVYKLIINMFK